MCYNRNMSETKVVHTQRSAYSKPEELTNFITHATAAALSIVGLVFACMRASGKPTATVASVAVYMSVVTAIFVLSLLCDIFGTLKAKIAQCGDIALLSSAVFIPVCLCAITGVWGYSLLTVAVALTAAFFVIHAVVKNARLIDLCLFAALGWVYAMRADAVYALSVTAFYLLYGGFALNAAAVAACAFNTRPARIIALFATLMGAALGYGSICALLL